MEDAKEQKLISENPVPRVQAGRRKSKKVKTGNKPLSAEEVRGFLSAIPQQVEMSDGAYVSGPMLRDLYGLWFRTGWRPNEIVALRFDWLSHERQTIELRRGRSPRRGGVEASSPKAASKRAKRR